MLFLLLANRRVGREGDRERLGERESGRREKERDRGRGRGSRSRRERG